MSRTTTSEESGFTLAGVIIVMTVMLIFIAYTVPRQWSQIMARERDRQALFVMKQYARSILEYQKRHGGLPTSLDQLKEARKPRFVRGPKSEWADPLTGEVDWVLVPPQQQTGAPAPGGGNQLGTVNQRDPAPTTSSSANDPNRPKPPKVNKDYVGPFVGVRPNKSGKSFLTVNGADNYEDWVYTVQDLTNEINGRAASLTQK